MILYLSSQKFGEDNLFLKKWIKENDNKLILIFNALDAKEKEKIFNNVKEDTKLLEQIGFDVKVIDLKKFFGRVEELKTLLKEYSSYCVMGGNVFVLRKAMEKSGFDNYLREISNNSDYLYIGYSAGGCVLSKDLSPFDKVDEPINCYDDSDVIYSGMGLIDYLFIPHYKSNYHKAYLVDELVNRCEEEKIKYKTFRDGETIIEKVYNKIK